MWNETEIKHWNIPKHFRFEPSTSMHPADEQLVSGYKCIQVDTTCIRATCIVSGVNGELVSSHHQHLSAREVPSCFNWGLGERHHGVPTSVAYLHSFTGSEWMTWTTRVHRSSCFFSIPTRQPHTPHTVKCDPDPQEWGGVDKQCMAAGKQCWANCSCIQLFRFIQRNSFSLTAKDVPLKTFVHRCSK